MSEMSETLTTFHPFPHLPAELRIAIYQHVLDAEPISCRPIPTNGTSFHHIRHNIDNHELVEYGDSSPPSTAATSTTINTTINGLGLTFTSRQISQEFLHYAYESAKFTFHLKTMRTTSWTAWNMSDAALSQIRHIRFIRDCRDESLGSAINSERELHFRRLVAKCPLLKTIEVEVMLDKTQLRDAKIKWNARWIPWCGTIAGKMARSNVWEVPASEWTGLWVM